MAMITQANMMPIPVDIEYITMYVLQSSEFVVATT